MNTKIFHKEASMKFYNKYRLRKYFVQALPNLKDVIAIKITDKKLGEIGCITWGRIFSEIELLKILKDECFKHGFENIESIIYCYSLQDIANYPYFYERWIHFLQQDIPYKVDYKNWLIAKRQTVLDGKDIQFTGIFNNKSLSEDSR